MKNPISTAIALLATIGFATANYDSNIATRAMYYSAATYCNKDTVQQWNCGEPCSSLSGFQEIKKIENEVLDTFGVIGYNPNNNEIVLAFRGTNGADFMNWMTNIVYYRVQYSNVPNTQVHSGFYSAYMAVSWTVISTLRTLTAKYPSANLLVTGHSLGGALATFAALDIKDSINPPNRIDFYTFGSPRTGNQVFTDFVMNQFPNGGYHRVTHYTDVVVQVPPRQMGFNHAGNEVWYYNSNDLNFKTCENNAGSAESKNCADSYLFTTGIDAHLHYLGKAISGMCTLNGMPEYEKMAQDTFDQFHPRNDTVAQE